MATDNFDSGFSETAFKGVLLSAMMLAAPSTGNSMGHFNTLSQSTNSFCLNVNEKDYKKREDGTTIAEDTSSLNHFQSQSTDEIGVALKTQISERLFTIKNQYEEKIRKAFQAELLRFHWKISVTDDIFFAKVITSVDQLSNLEFDSASVQINNDNYIVYTLKFEEDHYLTVTDSLNGAFQNKVVYSYVEDDDIIAADAVELNKLVERVATYRLL